VTGPGIPEGQRVAHERLVPFVLNALTNEDGMLVWQLSNLANIAALLGLVSAGWFLWWGMGGASRNERLLLLAGAVAIAAASLALAWYPPYRFLQVIDRPGIGPFVLYDSLRHLAPIDRTPGLFWVGLGMLASCGLAALVTLAVRASANAVAKHADPVLVFSLVAIVAYLGPFIATDYLDRYLLFVLPFVFVAWARAWPGSSPAWSRSLGLAWIAAAIGLGAVATRDYFAWNRARWDAIRLAEKLGGTPETIDGGFEYNGYRRFERSGGRAPVGKSWWWVKDDEYVVAFSPVRGYDVVERWPVRALLPRTPREIVLLKRRP
jgi:hypothetical protein